MYFIYLIKQFDDLKLANIMPSPDAKHLNGYVVHENPQLRFQVCLVELPLCICMGLEPNEYEFIGKRLHKVVISFNLIGLFVQSMCVFIRLNRQYSTPNEDVVVDASIVERVRTSDLYHSVVDKSHKDGVDCVTH